MSLAPLPSPEADLSKSERARRYLRDRITRQVFAPGYRLVLASIAAELGMSVVPVREAIRQLEAEGLVTFERNVGARVSMVDDHQYRDSMQTLGIVEGAATALAADRLGPDDIAAARAVNDELRRLLDHFDPHAFSELNQRFHSVLFDACPNARLVEVVRAEWARLGHLRDSTFSFVPGRARESVREHEELLALIERRAGFTTVEAAARRHRSATLDAYLRRSDFAPLPEPRAPKTVDQHHVRRSTR